MAAGIDFLELVQEHGVLVLVLMISVLVFSSVMELVKHRLEHMFKKRNLVHLQKVTDTLFGELAVLGLISFAMFMATGHDAKASQIALFESVHMLLFLILLFYLSAFFLMMVLSFYLPLRRWRAWEMVDFDFAKSSYDNWEERLQGMPFWSRKFTRMFSPTNNNIRSRYFYHVIRRHFLQEHNLLPAAETTENEHQEEGYTYVSSPRFAFSEYLKTMMCYTFIDLIRFGWSLWSIVVVMVAVLMATENDITVYIFAFATILPLLGFILHRKWKSSYAALGQDVVSYLGAEGAVEHDTLLAQGSGKRDSDVGGFMGFSAPWKHRIPRTAQDGLFWFSSPFAMQKMTKAVIYSESVFLALAILIIPDSDSKVRLDAVFVLPLNLFCFLVVIYLIMAEDVPYLTLLTSVGKYTRLTVVSEVIQGWDKPKTDFVDAGDFVSTFNQPLEDVSSVSAV